MANAIIEAMARAIGKARWGHAFGGPSAASFKEANAAYEAAVRAMTDEQLSGIWNESADYYGDEMWCEVPAFRAALLELGRDDADQD